MDINNKLKKIKVYKKNKKPIEIRNKDIKTETKKCLINKGITEIDLDKIIKELDIIEKKIIKLNIRIEKLENKGSNNIEEQEKIFKKLNILEKKNIIIQKKLIL